MATDPTSPVPDYRLVTERQQATWATGDFNELARQVMSISEDLCRAIDPHAGERVLDVACGSGNAALAAARRYCQVSAIDFVPALIERAKARALAEGTNIDFRVADAQGLPFDDASFDVVLSVFGVMFAPDQEKAASELLRVCRPGGRIGLASWMPEGVGGDFFGAHARYVPPPPGLKPGVRWGTDAGLAELLGAGTRSIKTERRTSFQYYYSIEHGLSVFRTYFGPTNRAFQMIDAQSQERLRKDLEDVFARYNRATDGTVVLESQYLQAIAIRA
jgi:ubiquinone/menaquinone biosynthesis C-methylase UbiE